MGKYLKLARGLDLRGNSYRFRFTVDGETFTRSLPFKPHKAGQREAIRFAESVRSAVKAGTFQWDTFFGSDGAPALADDKLVAEALIDWFRERRPFLKESSRRNYASAIDSQLTPRFENTWVTELTRHRVQDEISEWHKAGYSKSWIQILLVPLKGVVRNALADGLLRKDPFKHVVIPRENARDTGTRIDPFTLQEMRSILREFYEQQTVNLYQFAFWTGMRMGEIIALTWDRVDFARREVTVDRARSFGQTSGPKTRSSARTVYLNDLALEALRAQRKHSQLANAEVFLNPNTGRRWATVSVPAIQFRAACKRAGVRYRSPHHCRHTFATIMISTGENPAWVAAQLGHKSPSIMWQYYARYLDAGLNHQHGSAATDAFRNIGG